MKYDNYEKEQIVMKMFFSSLLVGVSTLGYYLFYKLQTNEYTSMPCVFVIVLSVSFTIAIGAILYYIWFIN